jgi:hypothetical protein
MQHRLVVDELRRIRHISQIDLAVKEVGKIGVADNFEAHAVQKSLNVVSQSAVGEVDELLAQIEGGHIDPDMEGHPSFNLLLCFNQ